MSFLCALAVSLVVAAELPVTAKKIVAVRALHGALTGARLGILHHLRLEQGTHTLIRVRLRVAVAKVAVNPSVDQASLRAE